jgi:hypothetical protein
MGEAMSDEALDIASSLAATLPEEADARDELMALGLVTTGVICAVRHEDRAELVETFCAMLRKGVAGELH